jgi:hypothetical protein
MQEGNSVIEHINNMVFITNDLAIVGTPILEELQVTIILNSLSSSFDIVTTSLRFPPLQLSKLSTRLAIK